MLKDAGARISLTIGLFAGVGWLIAIVILEIMNPGFAWEILNVPGQPRNLVQICTYGFALIGALTGIILNCRRQPKLVWARD